MAKIFSRPISGGVDNMLVLGAREALVIPFDFSGGFNYVKLVAYGSFTSGDNENEPLITPVQADVNYTFPYNNTTRNSVLVGFMNKDGFPGESGCAFVGICQQSGNADSRMRLGGPNSDIYWGNSNFGGCLAGGMINPTGGIYNSNASAIGWRFSNPVNMTGSGLYNTAFGMEVQFRNLGEANADCTIWLHNERTNLPPRTGYSDLLIAGNPTSFNNNNGQTYTAPWAYSGVPLELPKYAIIYNPFIDFRLRLSSVGIFKVS